MISASTNNSSSQINIPNLEAQTGLDVAVCKHLRDKAGNDAYYAAELLVLTQGYNSIDTIVTDSSIGFSVRVKDAYKNIININNNNRSVFANTPAGQKNELQTVGNAGGFTRNTATNLKNPVTGPGINAPCLAGDLLESVFPGSIQNIEQFCNIVRTHAWLSMPSDAFGGINSAMWYITGAVNGFYNAIISIYQGMQQLIRDFYAAINGIMMMINRAMMKVIESIIPLDLICLILDAVQTVLDDIGFFAQLFNGSNQLFNALNSIQTVVNYASFGVNFAYDPIDGLATLFPNQVGQIFNFVNSIGQLPQSFFSKLIGNFGFGTVTNNEGLAIANTIVQYFGLGAQLGPLGPILASAGTVGNRSQWYRTSNSGVIINGQQLPVFALQNPYGGSIPFNVNLAPNGWAGVTVDDFKATIQNTAANVGSSLTSSGANLNGLKNLVIS
jgi:hypothetical protein